MSTACASLSATLWGMANSTWRMPRRRSAPSVAGAVPGPVSTTSGASATTSSAVPEVVGKWRETVSGTDVERASCDQWLIAIT